MDLSTISQIVTSIYSFLSNLPAEAWAGIFAALGITVLVETLKTKFESFVKRHAVALSTVLSIAVSVVTLGTEFIVANPDLFGAYAGTILGGITIAYRYVIKPLHRFVSQYRLVKANEVDAPAVEALGQSQTHAANEFAY